MRAIPTVTTTTSSTANISSVVGLQLVNSSSCLFGGTSGGTGSTFFKGNAKLDAEL